MKKNVIHIVLGLLLLLLLGYVWLLQSNPVIGEQYAQQVYPVVSNVLSSFSSIFPFSLSDLTILLSVLGLLVYPFYARYRKRSYRSILLHMLAYLGFIYGWFYLAWGGNYFRMPFYERTAIERVAYDSLQFHSFLTDYSTELNASYTENMTLDTLLIQQTGMEGYANLSSTYGMVKPTELIPAKPMLSDFAMSQVGVLGYMAPFFSEFCVNGELLSVQYPFSYMHELAHRLGIASEAEANLYAYLICSASKDSTIRFSGYMSLFPYVMGNAVQALSESQYRAFASTIRPEIWALYKKNRIYWDEKYNPMIGKIQHKVYNLFLKGNNISNGTANYSQVIGLLLSLPK